MDDTKYLLKNFRNYIKKYSKIVSLVKKKKDNNLKDVLCHARKAEVSYASARRAHTYLANLVCLTEIRCPLHLHHTNHS